MLYLSCVLRTRGVDILFFFTDPATTEIYTLSLHDALPIFAHQALMGQRDEGAQLLGPGLGPARRHVGVLVPVQERRRDRKSTRLNSSHVRISYAVFCLKKKKQNTFM